MIIGNEKLTTEKLVKVARFNEQVELCQNAVGRIKKCRNMLEEKIHSGEIIYGLNTGIGEFSEVRLDVPFAWWRGGDWLVGAAVGISLLAISILAATAGAALPLLFDRMGLDPALMSAPFITTATDVAGVLIYLRTAAWLLQYTNGLAA